MNKKGVSSIIGAIFMILIVGLFSISIFLLYTLTKIQSITMP